MSFNVDELASTVNDLVRSISQGTKSIEVRTQDDGAKVIRVINTPRSGV